jgi:hypothetical protein
MTTNHPDRSVRRGDPCAACPRDRRSDIERELRASIADAVDGRIDAGGEPADAEVAVLTELGDPARLAAGYADRTALT